MDIDAVSEPGDEVKKESRVALFYMKFSAFLSRKKTSETLSQKITNIVTASNDLGDQEQKKIILNVAHLTNDQVEDIMTPRTDIVAIDSSSKLWEVRDLMVRSNHMRIPVYNDSLDHIKGFVHMKDVLGKSEAGSNLSIKKVIKPILFVPPLMKVVDLLVKMRTKKINIAIVVDEYGGTDGVITLEDLFEQVFGNIEENEIEEIDAKMFEVNARIKIEDLEEKLGISLVKLSSKDEYDTLAGYLMNICNKIPKAGEVIAHESGIKFHIKEAVPRFIKTVVIEFD
ncbi:MAG: CBS domain-containing protein [Rickettsiales bacterium]|jgi:magnesium and cobalt transporter|nr:CBS domain-containing protein [Rickettsiales bacterium]